MRYSKTSGTQGQKLDTKDRKILLYLSADSRMPSAKIAGKVGLSKDAVKYRIRKMQESGVVQGFISVIDVRKLGFETYHIFLRLSRPNKEARSKIIESVISLDFVKVLIEFSGKYDFEIGIAAINIEDLDEKIRTITRKLAEYLEELEVLILSKNYVSRAFPKSFISVQEGIKPARKNETISRSQDFDEKDFSILEMISENACASLVDVGKHVGLSADAANYRLKRLKNAGILLKHMPIINYSAIGYTVYAMLMDIRTFDIEKEKKLAAFLQGNENILWAVRTIGRFNLLAYVCVRSSEEFHETLVAMRNLFSAEIKEYETLVAYEEYKYTYFPAVCSKFKSANR